MNFKLFFALPILITNFCYSGFLTPTVSKLAISHSRPALLAATSMLRYAKPILFPLSKEDEFKRFVEQEQKLDRFKHQSFKEVESFILSNLHKFKQNKVITPFSQTSEFQPLFKVKEQQLVFNKLKESLDIPDEVQLYHIQNNNPAAMSYNAIDRVVYTSDTVFTQNPAMTLYQYVHELCHVQQHQEHSLRHFIYTPRPELEYDADSKALTHIKCPLCIKAMLARYLQASPQANQQIKSLGNFNSDDFTQVLQQKDLGDVCHGHQAAQCPNIWTGLDTSEGRKKIIADDYATGSILDRLP